MTKITLEDLRKDSYLLFSIENPTDDEVRAALSKSDYLLGRIDNPSDAILLEEFSKANCYLKDVKKPLPEIPEELAILAAKNIHHHEWIQAFMFMQEVFLKHVHMTKAIAKELISVEPGYGSYDKVKAVMDKELEEIAVNTFLKNIMKMKEDNAQEYAVCKWGFPVYIPLTKDNYKYLLDNNLEGYAFHFICKRDDLPLELKRIYLKKSECNISFMHLDNELIDCYFELYPDCDYLPREFRYVDLVPAIEKHGWIIKLISKPSAAERAAAIKADPMNIQYIKNPSEKDCVNALKANPDTYKFIKKRTKRICEAIGCSYEKEEEYSAEFYYVSMKQDLADEGYLGRNLIVKGTDMKKFLSKKVSISFGNLEDDNKYLLKDIASFKPITKEEIETLKKFGVADIEFGYWSFS